MGGESGVSGWRPDCRDPVHPSATATEPGVDFDTVRVRLRAKVGQWIKTGGDVRRAGQDVRLPIRAVRVRRVIHVSQRLDDDGVVTSSDQLRNHRVHLAGILHPDMEYVSPRSAKLLGEGGMAAEKKKRRGGTEWFAREEGCCCAQRSARRELHQLIFNRDANRSPTEAAPRGVP